MVIAFPSESGRAYTLWQTDTFAASMWAPTGLPSLAGAGGSLTFTVPLTDAAHRYFRIHAGL